MSSSRPTFAGKTAFTTRSVARQEFRLRPDDKVTEAIKYLLIAVARKYGLSPHCVCVLSNHIHSLLTDYNEKLPDYFGEFHGMLALVVNDIFGDRGSLWDNQQTHFFYLNDVDCIRKETGYTMANPVAAGLVEKGKAWPGLRACWPVKAEVVRRPDFFLCRGEMPKQKKGTRNQRPTVKEVDAMMNEWEDLTYPPYLVFRLERPPGFEDKTDTELASHLRDAVADAEAEAKEVRKDAGKRGYLGAAKVRELPRWSRSRKLHERFAIVPKILRRNRDARIEAWQELKWWRDAYADAFAVWPSNPNVEFPIGTYKHRVYHGANVSATAPPGFRVRSIAGCAAGKASLCISASGARNLLESLQQCATELTQFLRAIRKER